jgi:hypothetical protein
MSISRYMVAARMRCFAGALVAADEPGEPTEPEMAMRDERAHLERLGERQRLAVIGLAEVRIEEVGTGRDVPEQVPRIGRVAGLPRRDLDDLIAQAPGLIEPAEEQADAPERVARRAAGADDVARREVLHEPRGFAEPILGLARLTELRHDPGPLGGRPGQREDRVGRPEGR